MALEQAPTRRQLEARRFARFRAAFKANGGNAYRAALQAGYSRQMARSKSYLLARWLKAEPALRRLGLIGDGDDLDSYRTAVGPRHR